jgi:ribose 1,5-bisphosphokinase
MMQGRFISVVGPSGVGKDTVMAAMAARDPRLHLVRRVITRRSDAGGEVFHGVTKSTFSAMVHDGAFALHWQAHGLSYGIPVTVDDDLAAGRDVLVNLSRSKLAEAQNRFSRSHVVLLTATQEVLQARLTARGRETADDITTRLKRADFALPSDVIATQIDNSGALDDTINDALDALYGIRA